MKDNIWTWIFGAVGAVAGIAYLYQVRNAQPAQTVVNQFPPLNTPDPAQEGYNEPVGQDPSTPNMVNQAAATPKSYPVYIV